MQEISRYECWWDQKLVPEDAGFGCLRALVEALNKRKSNNIDPSINGMLHIYTAYAKAGDRVIRCCVGGCEAKTEITPELAELLGERSIYLRPK